MVKVLLEVGVAGLDYGQAQFPAQPEPGVVSEERRVHVDQVEADGAGQPAPGFEQCAIVHEPVLRIARHRPGGHALDARAGRGGTRVRRCDEDGFVTEAFESGAERLDRG